MTVGSLMSLRVQGAVQMTSQLSDADFLHQLEAAYANLHPKSTATALSTASRSFPQSPCIVQFGLIITSAQLRVAFEPPPLHPMSESHLLLSLRLRRLPQGQCKHALPCAAHGHPNNIICAALHLYPRLTVGLAASNALPTLVGSLPISRHGCPSSFGVDSSWCQCRPH